MSTIRTFVVLGALVTAVLPLTAGAGSDTIIRRGAAGAFFASTDPTGCIVTTVDVSATHERIKPAGGAWETRVAAEMFVAQKNTCDGIELLRASERGAQDVSFNLSGLSDGVVEGTVTIYDFVSDATAVAALHLRWRGVGEVTETEEDSGSSHQVVSTRAAIATGTLVIGGTNLTPEPAQSAALERISIRFAAEG
jgi:hypothetical protein